VSRVIRNDHPFTADEVEYLLARSGGPEMVEQNRTEYPPGSDSGDVSPDDDEELELSQGIYEHVRDLNVNQLQTELKRYKLSVQGEETELRVRLAQYLQEQENKKAK